MRFGISGQSFAIALACLAAAGCAVGAQTPPIPASPVALTISFPPDVTFMPFKRQTVQLTLTNTSSTPVTLQRPNDCQAHVWTASDASGATIDDRAICPMIFIPVTLSLAAHGVFTATQTVPLAYDKYRDGGHYTLHYTFWGIKADAPFTVHVTN